MILLSNTFCHVKFSFEQLVLISVNLFYNTSSSQYNQCEILNVSLLLYYDVTADLIS